MKKSAILLIAILIPETCLSATLGPDEISRIAEERAPLIKIQVENQAAARGQISQAKLLANPVLTVQAGSLRSDGMEGGVLDVTIGQPLPWPGKRKSLIAGSQILGKIAGLELEESRLFINHSATLLSIEYAILTELEKHNQERRKRFSIIQRALASRPLASPKQVVEKNLITTQLKLVESEMFEIETRKESVSHRLGQLTGLEDPEVKINWATASPPVELKRLLPEIEKGTAYRKASANRELAENRIETARYEARPDIVLGLNYRRENVAPVNHFYHANISVVIPIIDHGQHSVEVARAEARREEARQRLVGLQNQSSLVASYQALVSAYKSTELFRISDLKKTERDFSMAEDAFRKGRIDVTTFLQTDIQIHEQIDRSFMSYLSYYSALSEAYILTGKRLELK